MSAMAKSFRAFQAALLIGWVALGAAGLVYARLKGIPGLAAWPVIAALLVEYPFYLVTGFPELREFLAGPRLPAWLMASALLPYLICCCGPVPFAWSGLVRVAAVALALGLWYVVLPVHPVTDLAFLALNAAILLGRYFEQVYPVFYKIPLVIVGHICLFVIAVLVLMLQRRVPETGYGFLPTRKEWRIGVIHYLWFVALGLPLALALKATHFITPRPLWVIVGTFFAFLWFTSLSEEFLFRGVLQRWMEDWTGSSSWALLLTSAVFGLIHYWLHRGWSWVFVAALLGYLCGRARNQAGGIRADVVTHALVVTTWRALFW
jgi:membrane protease YdiL (CAAX protease family)